MSLKLHEYVAKRDGIPVDEAARRSLARTWELAQSGKVMSLITAFVRGLPYEQNAGRNMALAKDVRDAKFGYTPLYGYWTYDESDPGTGEKTGRKEKIKEDTLLVSVPDRMPNDDFRSTVLAWVKRYQQEARRGQVRGRRCRLSLGCQRNGIATGQVVDQPAGGDL